MARRCYASRSPCSGGGASGPAAVLPRISPLRFEACVLGAELLQVSLQNADCTFLTETLSLSLLPMVAHHPMMGNLSALVIDDNPSSLQIISKMLAKFGFEVLSFQTAEAALGFIKSGAANEEELDLVLAEVHLSDMAPGTLANSELLHQLNELHVPLITMCAYDDEEAVSKCMALGACFHVLKPLNTGSFNILRQKALQHKSTRATPEGPILHRTTSRMVSSSIEKPKGMFILERNNLCNPEIKEYEEPDVWKAHGCSKKPVRFRWTIELHEKFLETLEVLGDEHSVPERILKQMNVKDLTSKQIASHLQKHRLHKLAKQGGQHQGNASAKPVSELIRSAHNAATSESVTPRVAADISGLYPPRLWRQMKKRSVEAAALKTYTYTCTSGIYRDDTKSVWDKYEKSLQKGFSASSKRRLVLRRRQWSAKNMDVDTDESVSNEAPKAAGEIGYGVPVESSGSSSLLTSLRDQVGENNHTEAAGNNDNVRNVDLLEGISNNEYTAAMDPSDGWAQPESNALLDVANKNSSAQMDLTGPSGSREGVNSFWMSQLEGPQEQQSLDPEDLMQVDNAWNEALASVGLVNIGEPMNQEAAVGHAQVDDPVMPIGQDDVYWSWSPQVVGDYGMLF